MDKWVYLFNFSQDNFFHVVYLSTKLIQTYHNEFIDDRFDMFLNRKNVYNATRDKR